ncbi:hypothetical protein [Lacibacter sp. H407]|uniref:hypothetical protein n=1 Tax=Lacibacter sp. H407 TaxID=3133423 RepID=UPI0030C3F68F
MKLIFKILFGIGSLLLLLYLFFKVRQEMQYEESITITANYMQYACGDCSIDMKVIKVDNEKFNFIIGRDVFPIPKEKGFSEFCDFVMRSYYDSRFKENETIQNFILSGRLHKYPRKGLFESCHGTPYFTVEKIKYGNGNWKYF